MSKQILEVLLLLLLLLNSALTCFRASLNTIIQFKTTKKIRALKNVKRRRIPANARDDVRDGR